jgi:hypothetical protein
LSMLSSANRLVGVLEVCMRRRTSAIVLLLE